MAAGQRRDLGPSRVCSLQSRPGAGTDGKASGVSAGCGARVQENGPAVRRHLHGGPGGEEGRAIGELAWGARRRLAAATAAPRQAVGQVQGTDSRPLVSLVLPAPSHMEAQALYMARSDPCGWNKRSSRINGWAYLSSHAARPTCVSVA